MNRFLALSGYVPGGDVSQALEWDNCVEVYDKYITEVFQPGTWKSSYHQVADFLRALMRKEIINHAVFRKVGLCF